MEYPRVLLVDISTSNLHTLILSTRSQFEGKPRRVGSRREVHGIDFSPKMVEIAKQNKPSNLVVTRAEFLEHDFKEDRYDLVIAAAFIHLFPSSYTQDVLKKAFDLIGPGGHALFTTTQHQRAEEGFICKPLSTGSVLRYRRRFTPGLLSQAIMDAGFTVKKTLQTNDAVDNSKLWVATLAERPRDQ
ncbi:MAG: class I SAM-dependent methyltransferase [Beutenbergiaceae bacterium]